MKKESILAFLKFWKFEILLLLIILLLTAFWTLKFSEFKQLPGPLYGGDVYLYYAHLNHVSSGGSVFESHQYYGEYTHYPWLLAVMMSGFGKILGISEFYAYIYFGIVLLVLAGLAAYWVGLKIFENRMVAVSVAIVWMNYFIPWSSNTYFNMWVLMPLVMLPFFYKRSALQQITMGILYAVCALIDIIPFLTINIFMILIFIHKIISENFHIESSRLLIKKKFFHSIKDFFKDYWLMLSIGIPLAMLYWFAPIFIYHAQTLNPIQDYVASGLNLGFSGLIELTINIFKFIFPLDNWISILLSITALCGTIMLFLDLKKNKGYIAILLLFIAGTIGYLHPIITKPLADINVGSYGFPRVFFIVTVMLCFVPINSGLNNIPKNFKKYVYIALILVIALFGFRYASVYSGYLDSQWTKLGYSEDNGIKLQYLVGNEIKSITNVNDVILTSHEEVGYAINALTGRKVMILRRTHANPFVDINRRVADAAVIMYGNNTELRSKLLNEYNIKFFYSDPYALQNYRECMQLWDNLENFQYADQSYACMRTDPKYETYLKENGIDTKKVFVRLDIASNTAPRYNMLAIKPSAIKISLTAIKELREQNITYFGFYAVNEG
jgi:hypothetical protein